MATIKSIEEKAKAYDEALKVAKSNYETIVQMDNDCTFAKEGIVNTFHHIFPELKESEDEKMANIIREALANVTSEKTLGKHGLSHKDVSDWLEKRKYEYPLAHEKMETERWKEACKAACSDRNYRSHYGLTETRDDYFVDGVHWADEHPIQKPVEWSEEDAYKIDKITKVLDYVSNKNNLVIGQIEIEDLKNWLKSLKDRVQPQPKQEWSEEDIEILESCISLMSYNDAAKEETDWLKSLRPQSHWKPSESDIRILEQVIGGTVNPINYHATLYAILEQLKKL